ncbi:pleckstrin homology domain-containing family G member 7 [Protopterus annectens]|uniref:pleckstrin homology domain-containing family G member 7 n=1 Tax=Protopterus annectens TaxID=7888 RepID=UPI001CFA333F|nr:pleckstrin homology domain-containing family G member 7 [Protopterus annectens]
MEGGSSEAQTEQYTQPQQTGDPCSNSLRSELGTNLLSSKSMLLSVENQDCRTSSYSGHFDFVSPPVQLIITSYDSNPDPPEHYNTHFLFNRQAPARISTSPTLRRLRKGSTILSSSSDFAVSRFGSRHNINKINPRKENKNVKTETSSQYVSSSQCQMYQQSCSEESKTDNKNSVDSLLSGMVIDGTKNQYQNGTCCTQGHQQSVPDEQPSLICEEKHEQSTEILEKDVQKPERRSKRLLSRTHSSFIVHLPELDVFPGDLFSFEGAADYASCSIMTPNADVKKKKWPFSKKGFNKEKQKQLIEHCLSTIIIEDWRNYEFQLYKDINWRDVLKMHEIKSEDVDKTDLMKHEAVWELFSSECTYFLDQIMVLKEVFLKTLKCLQESDFLLDVDSWRLFANMDELCLVSFSFLTQLFNIIKDFWTHEHVSASILASALVQHFREIVCHSHQKYCLQYSAALFYLENLKQREDFETYVKWCEQNEYCKRLHLPDLLVAPLQRFTRYPLLLKNIWKRSTELNEKDVIYGIVEHVEKAIRDLEGKVKWLDRFQKARQLQEIIVWPPIWERDKKLFIPETLRHFLKETHTENLLSSIDRVLLYEGKLGLVDNAKLLDVYLFLFDDFLLVTKIKYNKKKSGNVEPGLMCPLVSPELQSLVKDGGSCIVLDQPIPLDRLVLKNIDTYHALACGTQNAFLILLQNRYQQCTGVFLFQAQTEIIKKTWMTQIETAASSFSERCSLHIQTESTEI